MLSWCKYYFNLLSKYFDINQSLTLFCLPKMTAQGEKQIKNAEY